MEYIEGATLFELASRFQLSEREIFQIQLQVQKGLEAIASAGFAHGDLNPKNILLTRTGDVKLIDFGSFSSAPELIGSVPYIPRQVWSGERPSLNSDLASWSLIARDLRNQFRSLPRSKEEARNRADKVESFQFRTDLTESNIAKAAIAMKVGQLIALRADEIATTVISTNSKPKAKTKSQENRLFTASAVAIVIAMIFPAQNLLSEPLKAAERAVEPAALIIRTHEWTEISVNGTLKGYAPVTVRDLAPGKYRIKYKRVRGEGELVLFLNPGQRRLLKDQDFKD